MMAARPRQWVPAPFYRQPYVQNAAAVAGLSSLAKYGYNQLTKSSMKNIVSKVSRKPRPSRMRPTRTSKKSSVKTLAKQVKALSKEVKASDGTLIVHQRAGSYVETASGCAYGNGGSVTMAYLETVLGQLRFFDSATPNTLVQASGASATYQRDYLFKSIYGKQIARNNYKIPVRCTIYCCTPKKDTSIAPATAFTNGLTDIGNPSATSSLLHLTDSEEFSDLWKIHSSSSKILQPGTEMSLTYTAKDMLYAPSVFDSHALTYQNRFKNMQMLIRVEGCLGHDSVLTTTQFGLGPSRVDTLFHAKYEVCYDAGIDLKFIYLDDTSTSTFTNAFCIGNRQASANQQPSNGLG